MKAPRWTVLAAAILWISLAGRTGAQEKLWVSSDAAKLKAETRATSATVAELPIGTELRVLGVEDRWYRVATPAGEQGWVYRGKVSETEPVQEGGGLFSAFTGSGIQVDAADTSRSIRGLSPEVDAYADSTRTPKEIRAALDGVLALNPTDAELEAFLAAGKIGEYAP